MNLKIVLKLAMMGCDALSGNKYVAAILDYNGCILYRVQLAGILDYIG